jgi:SOS-response transcriptional repressor LexA
MSWATQYIAKLLNNEEVQFRPRGNSMAGKIDSGQLVTVKPVQDSELKPGNIVLCKVNGSQYLHLIKAVSSDGRYQIGNNKGRINGWITKKNIFGIVTEIED